LKWLLYFVAAVAFVVLATTVKFGKRTLWGHVNAIWSTPEAKDARDGIKEKTAPAIKDAKRAVHEATDDK